MNEIRLALKDDEDALQEIMLDSGMDLAGDILDHAVIISNGAVAGGILLSVQEGGFHVEVIAVKEDLRGLGTGTALMRAVSASPHDFTRTNIANGGKYRITAVAKGASVAFYKKCGFKICSFDEVPNQYRTQCDACNEKTKCAPAAVIYEGVAL